MTAKLVAEAIGTFFLVFTVGLVVPEPGAGQPARDAEDDLDRLAEEVRLLGRDRKVFMWIAIVFTGFAGAWFLYFAPFLRFGVLAPVAHPLVWIPLGIGLVAFLKCVQVGSTVEKLEARRREIRELRQAGEPDQPPPLRR